MKAAAKGQNLMLGATADGPRPAARELERGFVCLSATVAEEDTGGEAPLHERRRERACGSRVIQIGGVHHAAQRCGFNRIRDARITVAEGVYADPAREIEVRVTVGVEQLNPRSAHELDLRPAVKRE